MAAPSAGGPRRRNHHGLRRVRRHLRFQCRDRRHHRYGGHPGNDLARLSERVGPGSGRRRRYARHPDPAQHSNDPVWRHHRRIRRRPVHCRNHSRTDSDRILYPVCHRFLLPPGAGPAESDLGRTNSGVAPVVVGLAAPRSDHRRHLHRRLHADGSGGHRHGVQPVHHLLHL